MRIVSLVPSLTESVWDLGLGPSLVGVTKFCVAPPEACERADIVGGTKDPDVARIRGLAPDLVLADEDENKPEHLDELRAFTRVHATHIEGVADAARELAAIGRLVGREHDAEARAQRIREREAELHALARVGAALRVFVPIWRTPLMTIGGRTYIGSLLEAAGARNVFADAPRKYFETRPEEVRAQEPDAVLLPTEPYRFREPHRTEFAQSLGIPLGRVRVVDGRDFTWFGTRTLAGLETVAEAVRSVRAAVASA